jgi:hypothetical protein
VLESPVGFRAYAEVKVVVAGEFCENTTLLYVSPGAGQPFRVVYSKEPSEIDGNGIRLIGWSPQGDKLLAEVNLWKYETDLGYDHIALLYDASQRAVSEVFVNRAFRKHFGPDCEFELALQEWETNQRMLVEVSKTPEDEAYEQQFCVKEPRLFLFDLQDESVRLSPTAPRRGPPPS